MYTTPYKFSDFNTKITYKPFIAGQTGMTTPPRRSAMLSRKELQRLVLDMVG